MPFIYYLSTNGVPLDALDITFPKIEFNDCKSGTGTFDYLISKLKYPYEKHTIYTEDNYILTAFRILPKNQNFQTKKKSQNKRPVAYFQHGLMDSSDGWILNKEHKNVATMLVERGYDVWLGNSRGNKYSNKHLFFTTQDKHYWDFSFVEMGKYDLTAMFNYILKKTKQEKLVFVGHSQGTLVLFYALSDPKLSAKLQAQISKAIVLSPIAILTGITNKLITGISNLPEWPMQLIEKSGVQLMFPSPCSWNPT